MNQCHHFLLRVVDHWNLFELIMSRGLSYFVQRFWDDNFSVAIGLCEYVVQISLIVQKKYNLIYNTIRFLTSLFVHFCSKAFKRKTLFFFFLSLAFFFDWAIWCAKLLFLVFFRSFCWFCRSSISFAFDINNHLHYLKKRLTPVNP
jgi:hypothetical protein